MVKRDKFLLWWAKLIIYCTAVCEIGVVVFTLLSFAHYTIKMKGTCKGE